MQMKWRLKWFGTLVASVVMVSHVTARQKDVTLLLVPRGEEEVTQMGRDLEAKFPTLLISYDMNAKGVSLHGWAKTKWVNVSPVNFQSGAFFKHGPSTALIIERPGKPIPSALIPPATWCDDVARITTTDERALLHLLGQYYDFSYGDWKWFAHRYQQPFDAINPEGLNVKWYQRSGKEHLSSSRAHVGVDDLKYWTVERKAVPAVPVVLEEPSVEVAAEDEAVLDELASVVAAETTSITNTMEAVAVEASEEVSEAEPVSDPFAEAIQPAEVVAAPNVDEVQAPAVDEIPLKKESKE